MSSQCDEQRPSGASGHAADRKVIERRDRVGLCPQPDSARLEARVSVVKQQRAVEPTLDVVANSNDPKQVPLTERRGLDAGARQLTAAAVVGVQPEIAFERVGPDNVVLTISEPKHDAARRVFLPG